MRVLKGIDISTHNAVTGYTAAATAIDFAVVKATQGRSVSGEYSFFVDSKFTAHLTNLTNHGVPCGVYHYLTAKTVAEARNEAEFFCEKIRPYKDRIRLWAAVDVEEKKYLPLSNRALLTTIVTAFCQITEANGFKPMIYTNPDFLTNHMENIPQYDLWLALWRDVNNPPPFDTYPNMKVWQYSNVGRVNGLVGNVDMNLGYYNTEVKVMNLPYKAGSTVRVTSPYGMRTLNGVTAMHNGIDLVGGDKNICANVAGKVIRSRIVTDKSDLTWQWGEYIAIQDSNGYQHIFAHLKTRNVKVGDAVRKGQLIGVEGATDRKSVV